jgi:hypothetical protein
MKFVTLRSIEGQDVIVNAEKVIRVSGSEKMNVSCSQITFSAKDAILVLGSPSEIVNALLR